MWRSHVQRTQAWLVEENAWRCRCGCYKQALLTRHGRPGGGRPCQVTRNRRYICLHIYRLRGVAYNGSHRRLEGAEETVYTAREDGCACRCTERQELLPHSYGGPESIMRVACDSYERRSGIALDSLPGDVCLRSKQRFTQARGAFSRGPRSWRLTSEPTIYEELLLG
jgi:hypothetical protein